MIQSAAYDIIKEEGKIEGLYEAISLGLEIKFGTGSLVLMERVQKLGSMEKLEEIKEAIRIAEKIEDIKKLL